jgi:hypothetical protein
MDFMKSRKKWIRPGTVLLVAGAVFMMLVLPIYGASMDEKVIGVRKDKGEPNRLIHGKSWNEFLYNLSLSPFSHLSMMYRNRVF